MFNVSLNIRSSKYYVKVTLMRVRANRLFLECTFSVFLLSYYGHIYTCTNIFKNTYLSSVFVKFPLYIHVHTCAWVTAAGG